MRFRPSNSGEGMAFEAQFCERCIRNPVNPESKTQCPHLLKALCDEDNGKWIYGDDGQPICTAFRSREDANRCRTRVLKSKPDKNQMSLF